MVSVTAWSNDEITMRIRLIEQHRAKMMFDVGPGADILVIQCNREIATWEELLERRQV